MCTDVRVHWCWDVLAALVFNDVITFLNTDGAGTPSDKSTCYILYKYINGEVNDELSGELSGELYGELSWELGVELSGELSNRYTWV